MKTGYELENFKKRVRYRYISPLSNIKSVLINTSIMPKSNSIEAQCRRIDISKNECVLLGNELHKISTTNMRKAVRVNLSRQEVISKDKEWITGLKRLLTSGAYESFIPPAPKKAFLQICLSRVNIMQ